MELRWIISSAVSTTYSKTKNKMSAAETNKQVHFFYQAPYQSNADYQEIFKAHLKLSEGYSGDVG